MLGQNIKVDTILSCCWWSITETKYCWGIKGAGSLLSNKVNAVDMKLETGSVKTSRIHKSGAAWRAPRRKASQWLGTLSFGKTWLWIRICLKHWGSGVWNICILMLKEQNKNDAKCHEDLSLNAPSNLRTFCNSLLSGTWKKRTLIYPGAFFLYNWLSAESINTKLHIAHLGRV